MQAEGEREGHNTVRLLWAIPAAAAALACACLFGSSKLAAMEFEQIIWRGHQVLKASGEIIQGDAVRLAESLLTLKPLPHGLPVILLNSPGGSVAEALSMSELLRSKKVHTIIPEGGSCASACASILFIAGVNRTVEVGGLLGQHSCSVAGVKSEKCNQEISENAVSHGVSYGSIHAFITYADPKDMIWFDRELADCWGITRYPFENRGRGIEGVEPCEVKTITGKMPPAHSAWRVDFEEDGYRAFLRPAADYQRELELSLFCDNHAPGSIFLSMDIAGPATKIKSAAVSVALDAPPIKYVNAPFLVSQTDNLYSRVTIRIEKKDAASLLTKVDAISFTLTLRHPYQPIIATTHLAHSRPALIFAAMNCTNKAADEP